MLQLVIQIVKSNKLQIFNILFYTKNDIIIAHIT